MQDGKSLISQTESAIAASQKRSPTEAGPGKKAGPDKKAGQGKAAKPSPELVDAINQVFALFRINYHNQYYRAYGDDTTLENQAKRLWLESLNRFSDQQILLGARKVIEESEYLPSLQRMMVACENSLAGQGIPPVRAAYLEACNAPSPKANHPWSHPLVYHAGREAGWHTLANTAESVSFPLYEKQYRELVKQWLEGREFVIEPQPALEDKSPVPDKDTARKHLAALRQAVGARPKKDNE